MMRTNKGEGYQVDSVVGSMEQQRSMDVFAMATELLANWKPTDIYI